MNSQFELLPDELPLLLLERELELDREPELPPLLCVTKLDARNVWGQLALRL